MVLRWTRWSPVLALFALALFSATAWGDSPLTWSVSSSFVANPIKGMSCPTTALCVGVDGGGATATSTAPGTALDAWNDQLIYGGTLPSVSCPSTTFCAAGTIQAHILTSTNPTGDMNAWTATPAGFGTIGPISCPSTSLCVAVDQYGNSIISTNPLGPSPTWTTTQIDAANPLQGVSCPSTSLCVATDGAGHVLATTDPTAASPSWSFDDVDGTAGLFGVSCASTSLCVAVDDVGNVLVSTDPGASNATWTAADVNGTHGNDAISCPSASLCVATDYFGDTITTTNPTGDASAWTVNHVDGTRTISAISCPSTSTCIAGDDAGYIVAGTGSGSGAGGGGGGGGGGAPSASLSASLSGNGRALTLDASGSQGSAASYAFQLGNDSKSNVTCPGQDPVLTALVANAVNTTATVTVTTTAGNTATATTPIATSAPTGLKTLAIKTTSYAKPASAQLGAVQAVSYQCTPTASNPTQAGKSVPAKNLVAGDSGPTTSAASGCTTTVTLGIIEGVGCFTHVDDAHPLPAAEAKTLCAYQKACALIGKATNPPLFSLNGAGARAHAAASAADLTVDAIYYSTQPVRINGLEVDPVNGGAVVLARAGVIQSNFWVRDSAYFVSSDAVVRVAGLPVSLHVPDYSGTFTQVQNTATCAQSVSGGDLGCLTSVKPPSVPDISSLAPTIDGPIDLNVSPEKLGIEVGEFTIPRNALPIPLVPSLPLTGTVRVNILSADSATVAVHVELPDVLSDGLGHGVTGDTKLTIDNVKGLQLDFLHVSVPSLAQLGLARLKNLDFTYQRSNELFDGKGTIDLGDVIYGVINAELVFENGAFNHAHVDYTANVGSGYPLGGPTFLTFLGVDLTLHPTTFAGSSNISIGPAITTNGCGALGAKGTAKLVIDDPVTLDLQGNTQIACADFGYSENFHADSNGNVGYGVGENYTIPDFGSVSGNLYGQAYADLKRNVYHFQIDGKVQAQFGVKECADIVGCVDLGFNAGATATFSDIGAGVCAHIGVNFPDPVGTQTLDVGAGIDNLQQIVTQSIASGGALTEAALLQNFRILTSGCDLSRWRTLAPPAGTRQIAPYGFSVASGRKTTVIGLQGSGDAPRPVLTGPGGVQVDASAAPDGISVQGDALVVRQASSDQTLVEIPDAVAGRWTVSAPGLTKAQTAVPIAPPRIITRVTGRGTRRLLHYRVAPHLGAPVTFLEGVDGGAHMIGTARTASGTLRFTPAGGSRKRRTIIARLVTNGIPQPGRVVGHYRPPALQVGRAGRIRVRRAGRRWRITFGAARNATSYLLTIRFADGRQNLFATRARRLVVPATPVVVQVLGVRGTKRGRPRIVTARRRR
jgi:hypothetical protein